MMLSFNTQYRLIIIFACFSILGCQSPVVEKPTWSEDIRPLFVANCVRCHGSPSRGGAPVGFRLDIYSTLVSIDTKTIGAKLMAEFIVARIDNDMPPLGPLSDNDIETIRQWAKNPVIGTAPDNQAPMARLNNNLPSIVDQEEIALSIDVYDADDDLVYGNLWLHHDAAPYLLSEQLLSGTNHVIFDPQNIPSGNYSLVAELYDEANDEKASETTLGQIAIPQNNDNDEPRNTAPSITFISPKTRDLLLGDVDIEVSISDPDVSDTLELTLSAWRDNLQHIIVQQLPMTICETQDFSNRCTVSWDTSEQLEGNRWRLQATVTDGTHTQTKEITNLALRQRKDNDITFSQVGVLLAKHCAYCHPGKPALGEAPLLGRNNITDYDTVKAHISIIYDRLFRRKDMPPQSFYYLQPDSKPLTSQDKQLIEDWILGGAKPSLP